MAGHPDQLCHAPRFRLGDGPPERRDPIVAPPLVVQFRQRPLARLHDQSLFQHPLDGPIQRSRAQSQFAVGPRFDILYDRVPVAILVRDSQEYVERSGWQRKQVGGVFRHGSIIAGVDILSRGIVGLILSRAGTPLENG